jgi:hypothetical protein
MSSFDARGDLNWRDGLILVYQGKKRSGKSAAALVTFASFPGDRVVIDVAGDDGPEGPGVVELRGTVDELPRDWPEHLRPARDQPMLLRYVPDPGSPTFLEDIDAVIGLAYKHSTKEKPVAILIHEIGVAAPVGRTQPHTRRMLMHNRHHGLVVLGCGPRSRTVDPLFLAQADLVYTFELPNPDDRQRTAETIGWNPQDFDHYVEQLKRHECLRFDANEEKPEPPPAGVDPDIWIREHPDLRLVHLPALPADVVRQTLEWAHDVPAPAGAGW